MKNYLYLVQDEKVKDELVQKGLKDPYLIEEEGSLLIGGRASKKIETEDGILIEESDSVHWDSQWESFAPNFSNGKAHIDLSPFGTEKVLLLSPGAGFGDFSHPTTQLMLEMIKGNVLNQNVIDLGSGSGILVLASMLLGAQSGIGVEIDKASLRHGQSNGILNNVEVTFYTKLPKKLPPNPLFLMNMIFPEQNRLNPIGLQGTWITSGILKSQKKEYLSLISSWGWTPILTLEKGEWMGWISHN